MTLSRQNSLARDLLLLTLFLGVLYLAMTWTRPLAHPDEGRYVEIPREMVESGDWITPRLNGVLYFYKPPLFYWAEAIAISVGGFNLFALRFWPMAFSLIGILGTYLFARRQFDRITGLMSAGVLGTSLLYFGLGQIILLDMAVSVFMALSLFLFYAALHEEEKSKRRWLFWAFYVSVALAVLSKGLMGLLIPGAVIFLWFLIFNQWKKLRDLNLITGSLLFLIVALPWHILVGIRNPEWFDFYIVQEHFLRYLTDVSERSKPFWFFLVIMPAGLFPWAFFLPQAIKQGFAGGWKARHQHLDMWFLAVWALFILFFFSISKSKLIPYILPTYPAMAVIVGYFLALAWKSPERFRIRWSFLAFAILSLLGAIALPVLAFARAHKVDPGVMTPVVAAMILLAALAVVFYWLFKRNKIREGLIGIFIGVSLFLLVFNPLASKFQRPSTKPLADFLKPHLLAEDEIYTFQDYYQDLPVYLERPIGVAENLPNEQSYGVEWEPEQKVRYPGQVDVAARWDGPTRIFGMAKDDHLKQFQHHVRLAGDTPIYLWLATDRFILFSNRPPPYQTDESS
ncbi:phospholipid carrier-dependent glycosyltransferase [Rubellicoccus peritrichatus]|uniref:Phospholipid carrier-dependent glycosyltransferase n=1 Tax=Rubellicoccus peritrichatus TaxID=3080537 RepID=A0AAQ3L8R1_9BACT|nr:phospholipid carrier-dependent glycosyltransferase [Puniceicoccus sp. CR14]WOO40916.1 phospholipid carrier-dependent glycosyltransferase [Puniceicoccus sp. CR14]